MLLRIQNISAAPRAVDLDIIGKMLDTAEEIYGDPKLAVDPEMFAFAGHLIDSAQARYAAWLASERWRRKV